ncbi:hypothetical protein M271_49965 [Streptomyces rapamycinicus NRRL 5491]|nr:hypothetical protein M271_49965 [Streptomyces rapamycinicus NRRL 5491]
MLTLAFLAAVAVSTKPDRSTDPCRPVRSSDPIDLTIPEIHHLTGTLFRSATTAPHRLLTWSIRRRLHQAQARRSAQRASTVLVARASLRWSIYSRDSTISPSQIRKTIMPGAAQPASPR